MTYFVALHTGAGSCSDTTNVELKKLCRKACLAASAVLKSGKSAQDAAVAATVILENSSYTNAGLGSSLAIDGSVQTEASICSSVCGFHCAGAVTDVKHPILIAELMTRSSDSFRNYINPRLLVGQGAIDFYSKHRKVDVLQQGNLRTAQSIRHFKKAKKYFSSNIKHSKRKRIDNIKSLAHHYNSSMHVEENVVLGSDSNKTRRLSEELRDGVEDTVGVICIDSDNTMVCTASSGGSIYKYSGRLGQCCAHGAGSYISNNTGTVTTGNGEQLLNHLLAINLVNSLPNTDFPDLLKTCLFDKLRHNEEPMSGFLLVDASESGQVVLHSQHTLQNMVFGYQSSSMCAPSARVLQRSGDTKTAIFCQTFRL